MHPCSRTALGINRRLKLHPSQLTRTPGHAISAASAASAASSSSSSSSSPLLLARLSTASPRPAKNQIFDPIRSVDSFNTHLSLSSSLRLPLVTLWTTSWCPSCRSIEPVLRDLVSSGIGEPEGAVLFAPVQFDAPEMLSSSVPGPELAMTYAITSVPTLLSFDAGEAQTSTRVTDARKLADRQFLVDWICNEARRQGGRGGGGGHNIFGAAFGGLFGSPR